MKYEQNNEFSLEDFIRRLKNDDNELEPCNEEELQELLLFAGGELPKTYIEFMKKMGKGVQFLRGESCLLHDIFDLKEAAIELLEENNFEKKLSNDEFVFWMHQGYMFCFFNLTEGDNPSIYFYSEMNDQEDFYEIADSFTEFLYRFYDRDRFLFSPK
ncbi:SMI1/KNR4 family protein [Paenibacillus algorifonticola]|uniref:SMI1/KNR4 family protein n=1 Tax=Paenibacillus algorifonticola TaxID=684063 RepID=UPI003D27602D